MSDNGQMAILATGDPGGSALACTGNILDIFEGSQQIQQLIIARRLLGKTSAELR